MADLHKCAGCGFLTFRHLETRELVGAEDAVRQTGQLPQRISREHATRSKLLEHASGALLIYEQHPTCYVGATDYSNDPGDILAKIKRERACDDFIAWRPWLTPKEHTAMIHDSQFLAWQKEREEADRRERREERDRDREFQVKQAAAARRHQVWTLLVALAAVVISVYKEFLKPPPPPPDAARAQPVATVANH